MNDLDRVFATASAVCLEAQRRWFGDEHDKRYDVPLAMLLDLDETLRGDLPDSSMGMSREDSETLSGLLARSRRAS